MSSEASVSRSSLLEISDLSVEFTSSGKIFRAVDGVSLSIGPGERFGMVGETGAGKSLTAWAAIGLLPRSARMTRGQVLYNGNDLTHASPAALSSLRGSEIAIIVQNPTAALSPMTRIGDQLINACRAHRKTDRASAKARAVESLRQVGIPDPLQRANAYPHELSIGMAQRVLIAMALIHEPKLLIADEPTSGLDVTVQAEILDLLMNLVRERNTALWVITHDLGVVTHYCERAAVIFAGSIIETGPVARLFEHPAHPYTIGLVDSQLAYRRDRERFNIAGAPPDLSLSSVGCRFAYRCPWIETRCRQNEPPLAGLETGHDVRCWVARDGARQWHQAGSGSAPVTSVCTDTKGTPSVANPLVDIRGLVKHFPIGQGNVVHAVDGVDLAIRRGEAVGLVGESGSGKSTLARCLLRLIAPTEGEIRFEGTDIARLPDSALRRLRSRMQMVFQDPLGSLNPRQTIRSILDEPLRLLTDMSARDRDARLRQLLDAVRLSSIHLERYPHQLSGGQQQRIGIARALATNPKLCVLDEPTSAVDWPIRAELLELLDQLRREMSFSFLLISHDLGAVRYVCERVVVMYLGRVVEEAPTKDLFASPEHPYSRALLSSMLELSVEDLPARVELSGESSSPIRPPSGCRLHPRCPISVAACAKTPQQLAPVNPGHSVACMRITSSRDVVWPPSWGERTTNLHWNKEHRETSA
jgi:peptide/nickel transport system ATP-binding protein